jgi:hypothetical protein
MTKRFVTLGAIGLGLMVGTATIALSQAQRGQTATPPAAAAPAAAAKPPAKPYVVPKTPWGEPDIQGMWPLDHLITTPFERPVNLGDRRFKTDAEFAAAQTAAANRATGQANATVPVQDFGPASKLTSLLSEPANGRFPALTPKGQEALDKLFGSYKPRRVDGREIYDSMNDFDTWDRCITRGLPVSMLTRNYNVGLRVMQSPGYVIIIKEMAHEARIIPTDGRPNLDPAIRQYLGESRGRWENDTLVIETLNFNGKPAMTNRGIPGSPAQGLNPQSPNMRIVERITRTGPTEINYKMTVEDPDYYVSPFAVEFPWELHPDYGFYEFACHEGNTAVRNYIETSRFERANPAPPAPAGGGGGRGGRGGGGAGAPAGGGAGAPAGGRGGGGARGGAAIPPAPGQQ